MVGPEQLQILTSQIQARSEIDKPTSPTTAHMASWDTQRATGLEQGMAVKAIISMFDALVTWVGVDIKERVYKAEFWVG